MKKQLTVAQFNALPRATRAVIIAKDVIQQLNAGIYIPGRKGYFTGISRINNNDNDAREIITGEDFHCEGCARACIFVSAIRFRDKISAGDAALGSFRYEDGRSTKYLSKEFSKRQQALIETAYEGKQFGGLLISEKAVEKCLQFRDKHLPAFYEFSDEFSILILKAICRNIIKNKGEFKP